MSRWITQKRDTWAWRLCTLIMAKIATTEYSGRLALAIQYGMLRMAEDYGDVETYKNYWTPTREQRLKMFGSFLSNKESLTLVDNESIAFITKDRQQIRSMETIVKKGQVT